MFMLLIQVNDIFVPLGMRKRNSLSSSNYQQYDSSFGA